MKEVAWIEAVDHTNTVHAITPLQVLTEPDAWRGIAYANPIHTAVVYRVLAAVHLAAASLDMTAQAYIDANDNRFWLDHPQHPFAQQPRLTDTLNAITAPDSVLALDLTRDAAGPLLWHHATATDTVTYTPAEATLAMLTAHAATPAGTGAGAIVDTGERGKRSSWRYKPPGPIYTSACLIPYGRDMLDVFDALAHSYRPDADGDDAPLWERDDDLVVDKTVIQPAGTLEWLTWPGMQVLLGHTSTGLIDRVAATPGWYTDTTATDRTGIDPFCTFTPVITKEPKYREVLRASHIRGHADTVEVPAWMADLCHHGPVNIAFIGQLLNQAKVIGYHNRPRHLPAADTQPAPPRREDHATCHQSPLF